jgi:ubiquinone/menaquinone biosynthesis C-methylase UbiE
MSVYDKFWQKVYDIAAVSCRGEHEKVLYPSPADELSQRLLVRDLLAKNVKKDGGILADVGCGTGRYFKDLARLGYKITGCDYSWNLLRQAKNQEAGGVLQAAAEHLPYGANIFDAVISIGVLQTVIDYEKGMDELHRILKPGGLLIMSTLRSPVVWELPFFPAAELMMFDHAIISGQWYPKLIKDRKGLSWHNRPDIYQAKRFKVVDIKKYLRQIGFTGMRCYYLGRLKYIPLLLNSQIVTLMAVKKHGE